MITPHIVVQGAERAAKFYRDAFGAEEIDRIPSAPAITAPARARRAARAIRNPFAPRQRAEVGWVWAPDLTERAGRVNFRAPPDAVPGMSLDHFDGFPLLFGPSPVHPLERLIADPIAHGCDTLVSIGGVESNDVRQIAAAAARTGMGMAADVRLGVVRVRYSTEPHEQQFGRRRRPALAGEPEPAGFGTRSIIGSTAPTLPALTLEA
jgi:catechol 2,3-dioxygenase-like lactoylglutathione lyase family enzyme